VNFHITFAVATLTVVLIIVARELFHPMLAVCLAAGGAFFALSKLSRASGD